MDSAEFYDNYIDVQIQSGINDRIYGLFKKFCSYGINEKLSILEIGCGIGTLTRLLVTRIKSGRVEAFDISAKSIEVAKKNIQASNVSFTISDVIDYKPQQEKFDRILLFDVLEHIPMQMHKNVFSKLCALMNDSSLMMINIPNPDYVLFDQKNNPENLQLIDQPLFLADIASTISEVGLEIMEMKTYSVWMEYDYQFFVIRKRREFKEVEISKNINIYKKGIIWFKRRWIRRRYPFVGIF